MSFATYVVDRAAESFVHVSGISMRRIIVAGRYGVLDFRSGSVPRTRVGPLSRYDFPEAAHAVGRSISRPRTPRHPPRAVRLGRIPFPAAHPAWWTSFHWFSFLLPAATAERTAPVVSFPGNGNACSAFNPFLCFPGTLSKRASTFEIVPGGSEATTPSVPRALVSQIKPLSSVP